MPYIKSDNNRREKLRNGEPALNAGELNYQIFHYVKWQLKNKDMIDPLIIKDYVDQFLEQGKNYQRYNDMTGCLIRCKKEIERRLNDVSCSVLFLLEEIMESYDDEIAKYEDIKIEQNGDVE